MTLHRFTVLISCVGFLGTACDLGDKSIGNDTGADQGETGDPGDGDGNHAAGYGGDCGEETLTIIDGPNAALPGFDTVAADYIAMVEGTFLGNFLWSPDEGPVFIEFAGIESPLTVTAAYEGGEIRVTEVELLGQPPQGDGGLEGQDLCGNILQFDVTLGFTTEDGLFAETFVAPITVYSHDDWVSPSFSFSLDMDAMQGELGLDDFVVEDGTVSDLVLSGQFDGELVSGGLNIEILTMDWVGFGSIGGFDAVRQP